MFPDWNFIRKPTLAAAAIAVLASTLLSAQSARQSPLLRQGLQALETGDTLKALQAWEQAEDPGYAIARYYLHLAATLKLKDHYDKATRLFYRELNGSFDLPAGKQAFEKDLLYLKLLMTPEEFENRFGKKTERELPQAVRLFWENADPLPTSPANPRLIEHYARVAEALNRFPDESSPLGFDDRGKAWVRYGEPDKNRHMNATDIWIYEDVELEIQGKLILYFHRNEKGSYNQIDSLDDSIPGTLMVVNPVNAIMGKFSPGFMIQLSMYRQLSGFDPYFAAGSVRMQDYFDNACSQHVFQTVSLATHIRTNHRHESNKFRAAAPPEASNEEEKISPIPLEVYQYRLLDEQGNPVLATFVESRPSAALLTDLTANQDKMVPDTEHVIAEELSRWYTLRQDVDLRDESGRLTGRLRSLPELPLDEQDRVPATSLFTIPHLPEATAQHFYVTLENHHPGTKPPEESVFPDELRGLGRVQLPQPEPLDLNGEGPVLGDLLIGYGRMEHTESGLKFPFVVSHNRTIPEGENLAVHFEAYRLQTNRQGFANFEVRYEIEPRQGLIARLLANRDELSGTLSFEPRATRFSESLEFEELSLEPGSYELHWTVRDLLIGEQAGQSVEFEVVEPK